MYIIKVPKSDESWPSFLKAFVRITGACIALVAIMAAVVFGVALIA